MNQRSSWVVAALGAAIFICGQAGQAAASKGPGASPFFGAFNHRAGIEVPAFHGIQPAIGVTHSSGGGNGFVGVGWSLDGITQIERAGKGGAVPRYNSTDVYFMDGQKLIPCTTGMVSPSCSSGGNYTTERESYVKIYFASNKWTITSKEGIKAELTALLEGPSGTYRWSISKVIDLHNNTVNYGYSCDAASTTCTDVPAGCDWECVGGQICDQCPAGDPACCDPYTDPYCDPYLYAKEPTDKRMSSMATTPEEVVTQETLGLKKPDRLFLPLGGGCYPCTSCTGQSCTSINNECYIDNITYNNTTIKFYKEIRTDEMTFPMGGRVGKMRYRLKGIDVKVGSSRNRFYALSYLTSSSTKRSLLSSVRLYGKDAVVSSAGVVSSGTSLPATTFSYQNSTGTFSTPTNYNSKTLIGHNDASRPRWGSGNYTNLIDMDGDGDLDMVAHWKYTGTTGAGLWVMLNNGTSFASPVNWYSRSKLGNDVHARPSYNGDGNVYSNLIDMNKDGRPDYVTYYNHLTSQYGMWVLINNGAGFNSPVNWNTRGLINRNEGGYVSWASEQYTQLRDMNGDGYPDFISYYNWNTNAYGMWVALNKGAAGTGFYSPTNWGTRSKLGNDVHARPKYISDGNVANDLVDMNGDGLPDYVAYYNHLTSTYGLWVLLNTGSGFESPVNWYSKSKLYNKQNGQAYPGWGNYNYTSLKDMNGDGLPDYVAHHNYSSNVAGLWVLINNGKGFESPVNWSSASKLGNALHGRPSYNDGNAYTDLVDMNGDGLLDYVSYHNHLLGQYGLWVLINNGKGFESPIKWNSSGLLGKNEAGYPQWSEYAGLRDMDGNGMPDYVGHHKYSTATYGLWVAKNSTPRPDLLTSMNNGIGGVTTVSYGIYNASDDSFLPPGTVLDIVTQISNNDGRGTTSTYKYDYSGALWDSIEGRFLGFRYAKETEPCVQGQSTCPYNETWFKQDYGSLSKPERIDSRDQAGKLLTSSVHNYTTNGSTLPYTSFETSRWEYVYDGSGASCSTWPCTYGKRSYLTRTYDSHGNTVSETSHGNYDVSGDETYTINSYYPNTSLYLTGFPSLVRVYNGTSTAGTKVRETRLFYDQTTSYSTAPTKGLLRQEQRWLSTTGAFITNSKTYDTYGNVLTSTDPVGAVTTTTYDTTYRLYPVTKKDALNRSLTVVYDYVCGKPTSITEPDGRITTTTYDALCRETQVTAPGGSYKKTTYVSVGTASSQYTQIATPGPGTSGDLWSREYFDGMGRTWRTLSRGPATGQEIRQDTTFDMRGNVWKKTVPHYANTTGALITATYDAMDRQTRLTNPDGTYATVAYGLGTVTTTDELGRWVTEYRNGRGQIYERREKLGASYVKTTYTFDAYGGVATIKDHDNKTWTFSSDNLGRRNSVVDPDTGTWTFTFDSGGRELTRTDAKSQKTEHTYDVLGRVLTRKYKNSAGTVLETTTYAYDQVRTGYYNIGKLTTLTDSQGSQVLDYDIAGNPVKSTRVVGTASYQFTKGYDLGGRLLWTTYPDGDTVGTSASPLTYDTAGRLKTIPNYVTTAAYDAAGNVTSFSNSNGTVTTRTYSANRGWLTNISTMKGTTTLQNLAYTRNNVGQVTNITSGQANEGWNYAFDDLGRLTTATNTSSSTYSQTFAYANNGNLTSNSRVGSYSYGTKIHAVTAAGANTYAYDSNGNMTSGAGRTITWNAANRPTNVSGALYYYTGDGERVKKVESGVTTVYIGDYQVAGTTVTKHVYLGGSIIAKKVGATRYWLHTDQIGSVQSVTDTAGAEVQRIKYRPYGERLSSSTSHAQTRGFTGQTEDASGLVFLNARYYDPQLGRFISADPTMPSESSQGLNRYSYANNDPVNNTDIDGLGLFSGLKKFFKKIGKALKKAGAWLQKQTKWIAKIPIFGGLLAVVANTLGAAMQGDWGGALRGLATLAIMVGTIIASGGIGAALAGPGLAMFALRMAAQAALGGLSGYAVARVNGASHKEALKAGLMGAAMGAAMEAFSSFMEAVFPKVAESGTGMKSDIAGTSADNAGRFKFMDEVGGVLGDRNMFYEGGAFDKIMGSGAMRGSSKLFTFIHDKTMELFAPKFYNGAFFVPDAASNAFQLFLVEIPLNFGTIALIEQSFRVVGEFIEARAQSAGMGTLGFLANGTLNNGYGFEAAMIYGAERRFMRKLAAANGN